MEKKIKMEDFYMALRSIHPINNEWEKYYKRLEAIRNSGIANMWGSAPILARWERISQELAEEVLMSWIQNYDELKAKYGW